MEKKGSDHFRDILNPYGEKFNYGKIGRRRRLSKLNVFFFHNSVGDHIYLSHGYGMANHIGFPAWLKEASKHFQTYLISTHGKLHGYG
jgi:hypothetical protein